MYPKIITCFLFSVKNISCSGGKHRPPIFFSFKLNSRTLMSGVTFAITNHQRASNYISIKQHSGLCKSREVPNVYAKFFYMMLLRCYCVVDWQKDRIVSLKHIIWIVLFWYYWLVSEIIDVSILALIKIGQKFHYSYKMCVLTQLFAIIQHNLHNILEQKFTYIFDIVAKLIYFKYNNMHHITNFLAHFAKGNASFCHQLASVVR